MLLAASPLRFRARQCNWAVTETHDRKDLWQLFGTDGMLSILRGYTQPHDGEVQLKL